MQEQERVARQPLDRDPDDVTSARQPCLSVSHAPFGLEPPRAKPLVREREASTAMVVLPVVDPNRAPVLEDRTGPRHPIRNAREELSEMKRRVGVVTDPEKEYLTVRIVHPADGAFGDMRWKRQRIGDDPGCLRSGRSEGLDVIASQHARRSPKRIRNDSEAGRRRSGEHVEWLVGFLRPGRHYQRAVGTEGVTECLDQAERSSLDRLRCPKGGVYQQDTAPLDSEGTQLTGDLGSAQRHTRHRPSKALNSSSARP
jgi:hypothetical protein